MDISPSGAPQGAVPPSTGPVTPGNKKLLVIIVAVVLGLSVLGWIGSLVVGKMVGFGLKKAIEAGTGVRVDEKDGGTVTFKGAEGQTVEIQGQGEGDVKTLPRKFPSDFPIMGSLKLESTYSLSANGADSFTIQWSTDATIDAVAKYYEDALKSTGWRITATTEANDQIFMSFESGPEDAPSDKKDSGWVTVTTDEAGKTTVGLFLTMAAK